jgi:hypothetical protein
MKRTITFATAATMSAIFLAATSPTQAQGWEIYPQGAFSAWAIAVHPGGTCAFAVNDVLMRRGDAGGTLWPDASLPTVPAGYAWLANPGNLAVSPAGSVLLAGGFRNLSDGSRTFNVFESSDGAATWRSVFSASYTSPRPPSEGAIGGLNTDAAGNIFVANAYFPGTPGGWAGTLNYYRVRKGAVDPLTGSLTWTVVDDYPGTGQLSHGVSSLTIRPKPNPGLPAEIWVAGSGIDAKTFKNPFVFVRRSLDGGATWTTANAWPVPSGYSYNSGGIVAGADANGVAFVSVGYQKKVGKTVQTDRLTYRSANQGASWALVDLLPSATGPTDFAADTLGGVFIAGSGFIRASADSGSTWVSPNLTGANCVATDLVGNVLVGADNAIYKLPAP